MCLCVALWLCVFVFLSLCLCVSVSRSVFCLSVRPSICPSVCLRACMRACVVRERMFFHIAPNHNFSFCPNISLTSIEKHKSFHHPQKHMRRRCKQQRDAVSAAMSPKVSGLYNSSKRQCSDYNATARS